MPSPSDKKFPVIIYSDRHPTHPIVLFSWDDHHEQIWEQRLTLEQAKDLASMLLTGAYHHPRDGEPVQP